MATHFQRGAFPSYEIIDEDGQAKPCVYGVAWVNPDTLKTLPKHGARRTGPKGEPLNGQEEKFLPRGIRPASSTAADRPTGG